MKRLLVFLLCVTCLFAQNTPIYPGRAVTINDLTIALNNFRTQLTQPCSDTDTTLTVFSTAGAVVPVILYIDAQTIVSEQVKCTGLTSTTFTGCIRGFDHSVRNEHASTAIVINDVAPFYPNQDNAELIAIETDLIAHTWWPAATTPVAARTALGILPAFSAIDPIQYDNTTGIFSCPTCATGSGSGNVTGPGSSTNGFLVQWLGTTGTQLDIGLAVSTLPSANTVIESDSGGQIAIGWLPTTGNGTVVCTVTGSTTALHIVTFDAFGNCVASVATIDSNGNLNTGGSGASGITLGTPVDFATLTGITAVDGAVKKCSNCNPATSPCTGGGSGAYVFDTASAHNCPF